MTEKEKFYQAKIDELDKAHNELLASQKEATGNQNEVFTTVSQRMMEGKKYEEDRMKLIELRNASAEVSSAVTDYLTNKKVEGKDI